MDKNIQIQLINMCANPDFSIEEAEGVIKQVNINEPFVYSYGMETTFLSEAIENENIKMVEVLLKNGANPNLIYVDGNVLWSLQYTNYDYEGEQADISDTNRIKITQMLLDYGANPNIVLDGETLFSYVAYKIFDDSFDRSLEYLIRFFILLLAYDGGGEYEKSRRKKEFDKSKLNDYGLCFNTKHNPLKNWIERTSCVITDEKGEIVVKLGD